MRKYVKKTSTHEYDECVEQTCDVCRTPASDPGSGWRNGYYQVSKTVCEVKCEEGAVYPEGGNTTATSYDICPECFIEKLVPLLRGLGAEPTIKEIDY